MKQEKIEDIREKMRKMRERESERESEREKERKEKKRKENIKQSFFHTLSTLRSGTTISNFSPELLRLNIELEKCR